MRNAASDVGPGGGALSGHEIADVVERDDAGAIIASRISGDANARTRSRPSLSTVACP